MRVFQPESAQNFLRNGENWKSDVIFEDNVSYRCLPATGKMWQHFQGTFKFIGDGEVLVQLADNEKTEFCTF
ncbi:hypothetical protein L596_019837 [Steinernema carpocapsae]|uniref:Uncharacterized protein n=1 Tax=Steinernema carpocapsae TaxID=34508 RepID=A0A4U5MSK9_STECR|nr:hypothetical protein L596_019837 [Steinernema carpocapsae]